MSDFIAADSCYRACQATSCSKPCLASLVEESQISRVFLAFSKIFGEHIARTLLCIRASQNLEICNKVMIDAKRIISLFFSCVT